MTPDDLQPGMYLVGRDDGKVDPFFVRVVDINPQLCYTLACPNLPQLQRARFEPDWWWERRDVPRYLPSQEAMDSLPPYPKERGE